MSFHGCYTPLFEPPRPLVHSSAVVNCFQSGVVIHHAVRIVSVHASVEHMSPILLGIYLVEFLGHVVTLLNVLRSCQVALLGALIIFHLQWQQQFLRIPSHPHQHRERLLCCPIALWSWLEFSYWLTTLKVFQVLIDHLSLFFEEMSV